MTTAACPSPEELSAFLDGALASAEAARVDAHLATCDACATALERLSATADLLGHLARPAADEALVQRVLAAVREERPARRRPWVRWALAASVVLGVFVTWRAMEVQRASDATLEQLASPSSRGSFDERPAPRRAADSSHPGSPLAAAKKEAEGFAAPGIEAGAFAQAPAAVREAVAPAAGLADDEAVPPPRDDEAVAQAKRDAAPAALGPEEKLQSSAGADASARGNEGGVASAEEQGRLEDAASAPRADEGQGRRQGSEERDAPSRDEAAAEYAPVPPPSSEARSPGAPAELASSLGASAAAPAPSAPVPGTVDADAPARARSAKAAKDRGVASPCGTGDPRELLPVQPSSVSEGLVSLPAWVTRLPHASTTPLATTDGPIEIELDILATGTLALHGTRGPEAGVELLRFDLRQAVRVPVAARCADRAVGVSLRVRFTPDRRAWIGELLPPSR